MNQDQRYLLNTYEQQAENVTADARRRQKADEEFLRDHPGAADRRGVFWLITIVVVSLILLWAHYGPIIRDAIYGV